MTAPVLSVTVPETAPAPLTCAAAEYGRNRREIDSKAATRYWLTAKQGGRTVSDMDSSGPLFYEMEIVLQEEY